MNDSKLMLAHSVADEEANKIRQIHPLFMKDRVTDAYWGRLGSDKFMRRTRDRIHWVCSQVIGSRILDMGGSQGITAILLAKEGKFVTGIDINPESIAEARENLAHEPPQFHKNISFIQADATVVKFEDDKFDTVIQAEILEHVIRPERLIEVAAENLLPGGRLVITVPFGINDWPDHKKTFYLLEPVELVSRRFKVLDIVILDRWMGLVADLRETSGQECQDDIFNRELLNKIEKAFLSVERELRDELNVKIRNLDITGRNNNILRDQIAAFKQKIITLDAEREAAGHVAHQIKTQMENLELQLQREQTEVRTAQCISVRLESEKKFLIQKLEDGQKNLLRTKEESERMKVKLQEMKSEGQKLESICLQLGNEIQTQEYKLKQGIKINEDFTQRLSDSESRLINDEKMLVDSNIKLALAEQAASQAITCLANESNRYDKEIRDFKLQLEEFQAEIDTLRKTIHGKDWIIFGIETEKGKVKESLAKVNANYLEANKNIDLLKGQLTEVQQSALTRARTDSNRILNLERKLKESFEELVIIQNQSKSATLLLERKLAEAIRNAQGRSDADSARVLALEQQIKDSAEWLEMFQAQARAANRILERKLIKIRKKARTRSEAYSSRILILEQELEESAERLEIYRSKATTAIGNLERELAEIREKAQERSEADSSRILRLDQDLKDSVERLNTFRTKTEAITGELERELAETREKWKARSEVDSFRILSLEQDLKDSVEKLETFRTKTVAITGELERELAETREKAKARSKADSKRILSLEQDLKDSVERLKTFQIKTIAATEKLERELAEAREKVKARSKVDSRRILSLEQELKESVQASEDLKAQVEAREKKREQELILARQKANDQAKEDAAKISTLENQLEEVEKRLDSSQKQFQAAKDVLNSQLSESRRKAQIQSEADSEKIGELTQKIEEASESLKDSEVRSKTTTDELRFRLTTFEEKKQEEIVHLSSRLETLQALLQERGLEVDQLKVEGVRKKVALTRSKEEIDRLHRKVLIANDQVAKTRKTLSFKLGYSLISASKSFQGLFALPGRLWAIYIEYRSRRKAKSKENKKRIEEIENLHEEYQREIQLYPKIETIPKKKETSEEYNQNLIQKLKSLKIAVIMDEFTYLSFQCECNILQLTPQHWREELEEFRPQIVLIESAWRGKADLWGSKVGHVSKELIDITVWCRQQSVPTVFWNKEDPIHFENFLNAAKLFDYVFTTDIDCIHRYKYALGHERVYLLPFACQPKVNNPIEVYERKDACCFAGAYYARYPERARDLENFMASLPEFKSVEIYDRNFGNTDANYKFPAEYQPFIVGSLPFEQIDKAYKGYKYLINMNSIKQSQSMFARRVFELLGSNTITLSNYSRGIRLIFGDLVICSDSGIEIVRRLKEREANENDFKKLQLAALRKVMSEHTYQDRLAYIYSKLNNKKLEAMLPDILVISYAKNQTQVAAILEQFERQIYDKKKLLLIMPLEEKYDVKIDGKQIEILDLSEARQKSISDIGEIKEWIAVMVPDDYYGPNYLMDLAVATRYAPGKAIGKVAHYGWSGNKGLYLKHPDKRYKQVKEIAARSGLISVNLQNNTNLRDFVSDLYITTFTDEQAISIDEFNYCKNGNNKNIKSSDLTIVNDKTDIDPGQQFKKIIERSENIVSQNNENDNAVKIFGNELASFLNIAKGDAPIDFSLDGQSLKIESSLSDGELEYRYAKKEHGLEELGEKNGKIKFYLECTPGLNIQMVMLFLDKKKQRIGHVVNTANRNHEIEVTDGTHYVKLGLRVYSGGTAKIKKLLLGHKKLDAVELLGKGEYLLVTNHWPSYEDIYRNGFVHRRVIAYKQQNLQVDVFRLRSNEISSFHEYEDIDCITGSAKALHKLLSGNKYKKILVHFLDENMWEVLKNYVDKLEIIVWLHGAEIQPYNRRKFNYTTEKEINDAKIKSQERMSFWRSLLNRMDKNLKLVFVSKKFAEEVMEDLGYSLPESQYSIIHNPIDTQLFKYKVKSAEQRKKILSIRPYSSRVYANDLSVDAILQLASHAFFKDLEIRMIGDGHLFDQTIDPLRKFQNIVIERRFLSQPEIAEIHKLYGIFLCPSRADTQGVSRDEAMASGLVPITNKVGAIPEFVDESCGILAPAEDSKSLADGIVELYNNPKKFTIMSKMAAERVNKQRAGRTVIEQEISLITKG